MKKKHSLSTTIIVSQMLTGIILIVSLVIVISILYSNIVYNQCKKTVSQYCYTASNMINGDKIEEYKKSFEKDDYYLEIKNYLTIMENDSDILYYYVFIPNEEDITFLWDIADDNSFLNFGEHESYPDDGKEYCKLVYNRNPEMKVIITKEPEIGYIATACYPIFNSNGDPVALVGVDVEIPKVLEIFLTYILGASITVAIVILLIMILNYYLSNKQIVTPIRKLDKFTANFIKNIDNNIDMSININSETEIGDLATSFNKMGIELKSYIEQLSNIMSEKERIAAELNIATQIQADMLPSIFPPFPDISEFDLIASMHPAKEVGGDFYDFYMVDDDHLCCVIADVSGKGVPAALFMVIAKTLIKNQALLGGTPSEILSNVNKQLCSNNKSDMFVTVWLGILQLSTGILTAANAGHEFPAICRKDGNYELFVDKHDFVLGGMESIKYHEYALQLNKGDRIFVYTDGVPEATNLQNEMYTTDRMLEVLNSNKDTYNETILQKVSDSIMNFVNGAAQFDDITMLNLIYHGKANNDEHSITVKADVNNLENITDFINKYLDEYSCSPKTKNQIDVALDELFSNISYYAYTPDTGDCTITINKDNNHAVISLSDSGTEYNPTTKKNPDTTLSAEERKIGGLGIMIVKKTMDSFIYERSNGRNIVTISKSL
jgi:phosphoserine phosphatase RsbU/P